MSSRQDEEAAGREEHAAGIQWERVPGGKPGAGHWRTVAGGGKLRLYLFPVGTFGLCRGGYEAAAFLPADQLLCILRQAGVF